MNQVISPLHLTAQALSTRRPLRRASQLMSLEQRFMFDAAVADAAHAAAPDSVPPPVPPAVTVRAAEPAKDDGKKEVESVLNAFALRLDGLWVRLMSSGYSMPTMQRQRAVQ